MRTVLALCCVLLVAAVNGGGLALAKSMDTTHLSMVEPAVLLAEAGNADIIAEATPVRVASAAPATPSGPCSASDCSWLVPQAESTAEQTRLAPYASDASILLALAQAQQLPPPRL